MKFSATVIFPLIILLSACTATRALLHNVPGQKDADFFPYKTISTDEHTSLKLPSVANQLPKLSSWNLVDSQNSDIPKFLKSTGTLAFIVAKNDTIRYEYYEKGNSKKYFTIFSLSKVFVGALAGIAIQEGFIENEEDSVYKYLPEFDTKKLRGIQIKHLLQMTSGIKSNESFVNPFGRLAKLYYGKDMKKTLKNIKLEKEPGKSWHYQNINTQLLSMIIEKATKIPLEIYMSEKIWKPLGTEAIATWSTDHKNGIIKGFCCLNVLCRDLLRFGILYEHFGNINDKQIIPNDWVKQSTAIDTSEGSRQYYQYYWYTTPEKEDFFGEGIIGQYLYVCPETQTVIVRIGEKLKINPWYDMMKIIAGVDYKPKAIKKSKKELKKYKGMYMFGLENDGDSSLYGKQIKIQAKDGFLKISRNFGKKFKVYPENDSLFFNIKFARKLEFHEGEKGMNLMKWTRRGNTWNVHQLDMSKKKLKDYPKFKR